MTTTVAAMRAVLGNTEYYILSMKAQELIDKVKIPKEMDGWDDMSIEERYQRDINYNRVKKQIAPYLAQDESRFFGSIILSAMNSDELSFEPLSDVTTKGLPGLYRTTAANMGFLTFTGGETLVPLDGQHRLKAIEFAITGRDEQGKDIEAITPCSELAREDVTVIVIPYDDRKARHIFTRVNRYAKPTTKGQNIVTDDDDIIAVLARQVANDVITGRLVKYASNTLTARDYEFTTLAIIYSCNEIIINGTFPGGRVDTTKLPEKTTCQLYEDKIIETWRLLKENIEVFSDACSDPEETGDNKRREIRKENLLGKPVTQECLVRAFIRLTNSPTNMDYNEACDRLNSLPWSINERNVEKWQNVLWSGGHNDGKIITKNRVVATGIIAFLAGEKLTEDEEKNLLDEYRRLFPESERENKCLPTLDEA